MILNVGNTSTNGQISLGGGINKHSVLMTYCNIEATSTAAEATVTFFSGTTSAGNARQVVITCPEGQKSYSEIFGHDSDSGVLFPGGLNTVTGANVTFTNIGYRLATT